jgi:putative ABC transport system permease protein
MLFSDLIKETALSLSANKARSALTILGIVIGIASVITMISIGQGVAKNIESSIQSLGSNLLVVIPGSASSFGVTKGGSGSASTLVIEDAEAIKDQISSVRAVAPTISDRQQIIAKVGTNTNTNIYGVNEYYPQVKNVEIELGSFIIANHLSRLSKVAVIGPDTRDDLFGEGVNPVGQKIKIKNLEFSIIGVTERKGGSGMTSSDDIVYIPLMVSQRYLTGNDSLSNINVQVTEEDLMTGAQSQINNLLLVRHGISDPLKADFSVINQADIVSAMTSITDTLTLLLGAIAGISLLVGGIGIMNMMLTTVTERTREIGLRKSLGAKKRDITMQFLGESVALTFIGGIIGILIGWGASTMVTRLSGTTTDVTMGSILLAFGVSALIGIIFGYYPAKRAAKLNPIDALRHE